MSAAIRLTTFHGGLHLEGHKEMSTQSAIGTVFIPSQLILPVQQHIGQAAEICVAEGQYVLKGETIARADGYVSVPIHAPTSGTITAIGPYPVPHPSGMQADCIVIKPDHLDKSIEWTPSADYMDMDPSALRNRIREAGIVGLGGAGFPSFIKLNPGAKTSIDELILNAAECEPYITCDDMLMRERAADVIRGMLIMQHALQARRCIIGIEDNKPEAEKALQQARQELDASQIEIITIPTIYPAGGEKQIIKVLTGKETPSQGLPLDIGVVCHNVATAATIYHALEYGAPLLSRVVTVTGEGIRSPGNHEVLIGTPINELIEHCGGYVSTQNHVIMGGPMMGFKLESDQLPVIKTTNCLLVMPADGQSSTAPTMPCIRCGACMDVCPAQLLPQQLYWHAHSRDFDKIQEYNLFDCIECGCCSYVCPSHIPLVQYYRFAKTEIWAQERDKLKSDHARDRHEFRLARLEREKQEREEKMRKKKAALNSKSGKNDETDAKKKAIQEALQRVQNKKQQQSSEKKNTDNLTPEQQQKIKAVDARRAASKETQE